MTKRSSRFAIVLAVLAALHPGSAWGEDCSKAAKLAKRGALLADASTNEEKLYTEALELCPQLAAGHYNLGLLRLKRGDQTAAKEEFTKALKSKPSAATLSALAGIYWTAGDLEQAREHYDQALTEDAEFVPALQGLALILEREGRRQEAIDHLLRAEQLDAHSVVTLLNLAVLYDQNADRVKARKYYELALEENKEHLPALLGLGLMQVEQQDYESGAILLRRAAETGSTDAAAYRGLGIAYEKLEELDKAELALRKATELAPNDLETVVNLAVVLIRNQKEALAKTLLEESARKNGEDARLLSVLGWAQIELGEYPEAEKSLSRALELDAMNLDACRNLEVLYRRTGRPDDAKKYAKCAGDLEEPQSMTDRN